MVVKSSLCIQRRLWLSKSKQLTGHKTCHLACTIISALTYMNEILQTNQNCNITLLTWDGSWFLNCFLNRGKSDVTSIVKVVLEFIYSKHYISTTNKCFFSYQGLMIQMIKNFDQSMCISLNNPFYCILSWVDNLHLFRFLIITHWCSLFLDYFDCEPINPDTSGFGQVSSLQASKVSLELPSYKGGSIYQNQEKVFDTFYYALVLIPMKIILRT